MSVFQGVWADTETTCWRWAAETMKRVRALGSSPGTLVTSHWVYQRIHLKDSGNHYARENWRNDRLVNDLRHYFHGMTPEEGWQRAADGSLLSPEGISIILPGATEYMSDEVLRLTPQVHLYGMPGWHLVTSPQGNPLGPRVRFYVPGLANTAALPVLSRHLQSREYKWHLKIRSDICDPRPDRVVLYVDESAARTAADELYEIIVDVSPDRSELELPTFCWSSSEGLGYAPDLPNGHTMSFGQMISQTISDYLVKKCSDADWRNLQEALETKNLTEVLLRQIERILGVTSTVKGKE